MDKYIVFLIIKYLPVNLRGGLAFVNKEFYEYWKEYQKKYFFVVTDVQVDVGMHIDGYGHNVLASTNNYSEALSIYNNVCNKYFIQMKVSDKPYYHKKSFIHNTSFTGIREGYHHNFIVTLFPVDFN